MTEYQRKISRAAAIIREMGDTQEARRRADQSGDKISSAQWRKAAKRVARAA